MGSSLQIFAPAKINLYLHVTGRLDNGYHTLDSLVNFADIGDDILIEAADDFSFNIDGRYAAHFPDDACKSDDASTNLIVRAVFALAQKLERLPHFKITLTKNLPLASGIGGGSSNAAAVIWGLLDWWGLPSDMDFLPDLFLQLGADVPVCYFAQPARILGIGDRVEPITAMPEMDIVLVNPNKSCHTASVFTDHLEPFRAETALPDSLSDIGTCVDFLRAQGNDLTSAATRLVPDIALILPALSDRHGCLLSRLSGSGATCFGVFDNATNAQAAAQLIAQDHPDWWVAAGCLNRIERY